MTLLYDSCVTSVPQAAALLHNDKITDNSPEAAPMCISSPPRASSALVYQQLYTSPTKSPPKSLLLLRQVQHTEQYCVCVWVDGCVCQAII